MWSLRSIHSGGGPALRHWNVLPTHLPRLEQAPVVVRAFTAGDVALIQDASGDPLIPLITSVPTTPDLEAARAFIGRQHDRLRNGLGYSFAIADSSTDEAVGQIGLWPSDVDRGRASIGYWVCRRHRGHGLAAHALRLISAWGLGLPGVDRLELCVEPWNAASWRTAEHAGFQREGLLRSWQVIRDERRDMLMYSKVRPLMINTGRPVPGRPRSSRPAPEW